MSEDGPTRSAFGESNTDILASFKKEIMGSNKLGNLVLRDDQRGRGGLDVVCNAIRSDVLNIDFQRAIRDHLLKPPIRRYQRRPGRLGASDVEAIVDGMVDLCGDLSCTLDQIGTGT